MTASATEKTQFRLEFGGDATTLTDEYIDSLFDLAESIYDPTNRHLIQQAAYLSHAKYLMARVESEVDYTANTASEKLSQRYPRLAARVAKYEQAIEGLTTPAFAAQWAGLRKTPPPVRGYPDDIR